MLIFLLYLILLTGLIAYNGFFKLFDDPIISRKKFAFLFLGKALAVPVFLFVYTKMYGGIEGFDTGKFFNDAKVISEYGKKDLNFLIRILSGFQDDTNGSYDFLMALKNTDNWDNGTMKDYLYNDNRVVIRLHVLLNFLAFGSYPAHALFNCFLSFTGILFFYKTFKEWFPKKELLMLFILCFFPALWFYTGALLKEGITFFVLGSMLWQLKSFINGNRRLFPTLWLLFLLFICMLLKPYLLIFAAICFGLFFILYRTEKIKRKILFFFSIVFFTVILLNIFSVFLKDRTLLQAALKQQHQFVGVSRGGIFLADSTNFIRLTNDTSQMKKIPGTKDFYTIRKDVSFMYWKTVDQLDTLVCNENKDTLTSYQLMYTIQPSKSNVKLPDSEPFSIIAACYYYTLFYPTIFNARNALQMLAALENLLILFSLILILTGLIKSKKDKFLPLTFIFFALALSLLIGLTAPNSGAIFRYRSPAMVFLLLTALYYTGSLKKLSGFFKKPE